ncbi:MAG: CvpA family protein [Clostridia bacterium]|nr:CvpA family protein [Clostridia bacterium]
MFGDCKRSCVIVKKALPIVIRVLISAILIFLIFWFALPAINLRSGAFWTFLFWSLLIVVVVNFTGSLFSFFRSFKNVQNVRFVPSLKKAIKSLGIPVLVILGSFVTMIVFSAFFNLIGVEMFNASRYKDLITVQDGNFAQDVAELNMSQIPVVDRDSSMALGKRKLGEMSDLVSQFEIASDYTQINYKDSPVRVTPLKYGDAIKWLYNQSEGIPGYLRVDMTTQDVTLVRLEEGIRYSESEYFMRNIHRYLRFRYPSKIFADVSFEIDDDGAPYWVASTVKYQIGFWSGRDIGGVVLVNAVTGECSYFDVQDAPTWIDQVYDSELVLEQLIYNGKYRSGFCNSLFGQKGVLTPTEGYNYIALDDDVWLYTGMTSVVSDESNVGFVLVNLRTKETRYYAVPGAEEYSAMDSAEGQVQHLSYEATFPLLLNVGNRPTYFMSLKDSAGLVKMYAFVDVQQYQLVGTGTSVDAAREDYLQKLAAGGQLIPDNSEPEESRSAVVLSVVTAVVNGNSKYYIMLDDGSVIIADISLSADLPFLAAGDTVTFTLSGTDATSLSVTKVNFYPEGK